MWQFLLANVLDHVDDTANICQLFKVYCADNDFGQLDTPTEAMRFFFSVAPEKYGAYGHICHILLM